MPTPMTNKNGSIREMLKRQTIAELLTQKKIYTPEDAAPYMDYTAMHIRYLCREKRIEHIERNGQYYLYARTVHSIFKHVPESAKKSR